MGFLLVAVTRGTGPRDLTGVNVADLVECYEKHAEALLRFAASQVGPSDADDVLAAAVLGVLGRTAGDVDDLKAYLYRAVANEATKHWRTIDRRRKREQIASRRSLGFVDVDPHLSGSLGHELASALARLSAQQRAVLYLTYWEDLTPVGVAARLSVSEGTVRRQLARGRRRLREALK